MKMLVKVSGCLIAACFVVVPFSAGAAGAASPHPGNPHVTPQRGGPHAAPTNLVDHGGPVLAASKTYAIWWGDQRAFPNDATTGIDDLLGGLGRSNYLDVAGQYMRGSRLSTNFVTNWTDTSAPPDRSPSVSAVVSEVSQAIAANGATPDPSATYFVYTSNFPRGAVKFCGWHAFGTAGGVQVQVAYLPNITGIAGCDPGNTFDQTGFSQGTRALANVTAHEFMESITDPDLSAWYDSSGQEIGDKCAWQFASTVDVGGLGWQLQEEWSNAASGCVQGG